MSSVADHRRDTLPIAILGGGPTGLATALLLRARGFAAEIFDARPLDDAQRDPRLLALSRGSWELLASFLAKVPPPRAPIRHVHVSSSGEFGVTRIDADDPATPLGATVRYGDLVRALAQAVAETGIVQHRPQQIVATRLRPDAVELDLGADAPARYALVVHAEGAATAAPPADGPQALLADVRLDGLAPGVAIERFTRSGPLALLPVPGSDAARALVWCSDAPRAQARLALDELAFVAELQTELGTRIGRVVGCGPRRSYPLQHALRATVRAHRSVWLGNAAQTLHPVAGQGLNLGLRDCVTLAEALATHPGDVPAALHQYAQLRSADRQAIAGLTRLLPAVFATRFAPLALARSLGLTALDLAPPLRDALARLLIFGVRN